MLGFLGPNGAGKSTTMRMVTGFLAPTAGTAVISGHDIVDDSVAARKQIGYLPENAPAYDDMTVEEFLRFIARMRGFTGSAIADRAGVAIERCFLGDVRRRTIETLSKGYRQRTCFAQAILHDPPVLILDEPTSALDPKTEALILEALEQLVANRTTFIIAHRLSTIRNADRIIVLKEGVVVEQGTHAELIQARKEYWQYHKLQFGESLKESSL